MKRPYKDNNNKATRRRKWFVGNETNQAIRRETVPYGSASMA